MWSLPGLFNDLAKKVRNILVAGNPKYKKTDSMKSHPLWVTLYSKMLEWNVMDE